MVFRVLLCIVYVSYLFAPSGVMAAQAQGDIGVTILNYRTLDLTTLKKICKEEPETMACDLYEEKKLDQRTNKSDSYSVYTANFQ